MEEIVSVPVAPAGKLDRSISSLLLLVAMVSEEIDSSLDAILGFWVVLGGPGHVLSCSELFDDTPGSEAGLEMAGCSVGNGGTTSMLPCRLPAPLLSEGCRLLAAVEGLEESPVPWRTLGLFAPAEAERFLSCSNTLRLCASDIRPLGLVRGCSFFFDLLVGNGGNGQS